VVSCIPGSGQFEWLPRSGAVPGSDHVQMAQMRQRHRLGVAVEVLRSKTTRLWASLAKQTPFRGATACVLSIGELARALRSIGAKRVRREGRQWVWRMGDSRRAVKR
jgi:hypothetical protein